MTDAKELMKILSDDTRLAIVNILYRSDSYVELIASKLGITEATVCYHLKKMEQAGLVSCSRSQFYIIYSLNKEILGKRLDELIIQPNAAEDSEEKYRLSVIKAFFKNGRLVKIPVQQKKRLIVLEEIADHFERGRSYDEKEVSEKLKEFHEDYCYLRRSMIEFGIMERENGIYRLRDDR